MITDRSESKRLCRHTLDRVPATVGRPSGRVLKAGIGIVHLGLGSFHRAHQAMFTDRAMAADGGDWGICGVSLRSARVRDALAPQDGLYTLLTRDAGGTQARIIGSVHAALALPEDPERVLARMAAADTRVISLTVTEKGYGGDPASGRLSDTDADLTHDLAAGPATAPRSTLGLLARALARRRKGGTGPVTLLSCDNLSGNGDGLRRLLLAFLDATDQRDLAAWMADTIPCPDTMVDRIVPAPTDTDRAEAARLIGLEDAATVATEPFAQWVIEDRFAASRPAWERVGATLTADVAGWEAMKLRLLNAAHSLIAYLGGLAGFATVDQAIADPGLRRHVETLWDEAETTLVVPAGADVAGYRRALLERFANPALGHRTAQIAMDGSQKLPVRILGTILDRRRQGAPVDSLCLAVAAWMAWIARRDRNGVVIPAEDPLSDRLASVAADAGADAERLLDGVCVVSPAFSAALATDPVVRSAIEAHLRRLIPGADPRRSGV